ncbi:cysteine hydrolase [uncultured Algibacter sp.]|uniref:cysteine hydrolase n=1 Tax=uncultured Algibacter sp. TaxID=298659 RepID=UPI00260A61E6|nr:cysteine hydrolase [uncultured Algibacter sp.]
MNRIINLIIVCFTVVLTSCEENSKLSKDVNHQIEKESKSELNKFSTTYSIGAKPDSISFMANNTAVIVVDMQNDFGSKGGLLDFLSIDISEVQKVVEPTKKVINASRKAEIPIIYFKMGYKADLSDLGSENSINRIRKPYVGDTIIAPNGEISRIQIQDTWNTDIIDALKPHENDIIIEKTRYSGFYNTTLDSILKKKNITNLVFTSCTTSICLESTVRDAMYRDYNSIVLEDCTVETIGSNLSRTNYEASILNIQIMFGWISNSMEYVNALRE